MSIKHWIYVKQTKGGEKKPHDHITRKSFTIIAENPKRAKFRVRMKGLQKTAVFWLTSFAFGSTLIASLFRFFVKNSLSSFADRNLTEFCKIFRKIAMKFYFILSFVAFVAKFDRKAINLRSVRDKLQSFAQFYKTLTLNRI